MAQIAGILPMLGKIMPAVTGGMGVLSNVIRGNRVDQAQKAALQKQKELQQLIANPALLAAKARALQQPLNQGLVQGVENQAQAGLAERGLGTSPQIANEVFAQALGPYEHQNQMEALRSVLQMYGMDDTAINTIIGAEGQPTDTSGLWGAMQKAPYKTTTVNPTAPPTIPHGDPGITVPPTPDVGGGGTSPFPTPGAGGGGDFPGTGDIWGDLPL